MSYDFLGINSNLGYNQIPMPEKESEGVKEKPKCPALFFFGAGASVPAKVPTTIQFVDEFRNTLNNSQKALFDSVRSKLNDWARLNKKESPEAIDVELILETFDRLENPKKEVLSSFIRLNNTQTKQFKDFRISSYLKGFIKLRGQVKAEDTDYLKPLRDLLTIYNSIDIISTNYDTVVEQFCSNQRISYEDGFGNVFEVDRLRDSQAQIRLFKVHGSILWYKSDRGQFYKFPVEVKDLTRTVYGENIEPLIMYPMRKWEYIEPTFELISQAKRLMRESHINFIYVFGYSFRDAHILDIFLDVFRDRPDLLCILVDPNAYQIYENRLRYNTAQQDSESSMAGRVVCKPFRIEKELQYFNVTSLDPLINAIKVSKNYELQRARHALLNWDEPAYHLLSSHYLSEFEKWRNQRKILEMNKDHLDLLRICLLYVAHQMKRSCGSAIYFGLDQLLYLLQINYVNALEIQIVGDSQVYFKLNLKDQYGNNNAITVFPSMVNNLANNLTYFWNQLSSKFSFSESDIIIWQFELSNAIHELSLKFVNNFSEITKHGSPNNAARDIMDIEGIINKLLFNEDKPYTANAELILGNSQECLNIVLNGFAQKARDILSKSGFLMPEKGWFMDPNKCI
jgi:hypothetical protein